MFQDFGTFWNILELFGISWNMLERVGTPWNTLEHIGTPWNILEHLGTLFHLERLFTSANQASGKTSHPFFFLFLLVIFLPVPQSPSTGTLLRLKPFSVSSTWKRKKKKRKVRKGDLYHQLDEIRLQICAVKNFPSRNSNEADTVGLHRYSREHLSGG